MELKVNGAEAVQVSDVTFGTEFNETLVHQAVVAFMAGARQGTRGQKSRSDVSGGGRKPWRQGFRSCTRRYYSVLWRGGGKTFAAKPQNHAQKLNKKMYRGALRSILSELVRQDRLVVVDQFTVETAKTKLMVAKLNELNVSNVLIVSDEVDQNVFLASRNIPHVDVRDVQGVDPVSLVAYEKVVMTVAAIKKFEEMLG